VSAASACGSTTAAATIAPPSSRTGPTRFTPV
jgi:hypothetical protein